MRDPNLDSPWFLIKLELIYNISFRYITVIQCFIDYTPFKININIGYIPLSPVET